jgi:hypothetical protein
VPDYSEAVWNSVVGATSGKLDLGADVVLPAYDGFSLLNLPGSICKWFGVEAPRPPLIVPELNAMAEGISQIAIVLVDALSFTRFRAWLEDDLRGLAPFVERGLLMPMTSVVPSTTSAALTTLWTGRPPVEHGIVGYELFLREFGLIANMITQSPAAFPGVGGGLAQAGESAGGLLPVPTLGPLLAQHGVETHVFMRAGISDSGLSRMLYSGAALHGVQDLGDMWNDVCQLVDSPLQGKRLIWIYFANLDTFGHRYGPDSEQVRAELRMFVEIMLKRFLGQKWRRRGELLWLLTSDHGQIYTPKNPSYDLGKHPLALKRLHMQPSGENRFAYFFVRPGQVKGLLTYFATMWGDAFKVVPSREALRAGLFGLGKLAPTIPDRLGDLIAMAQGDAYLWWGDPQKVLLGRHGGLSTSEMLVPLLAARLA